MIENYRNAFVMIFIFLTVACAHSDNGALSIPTEASVTKSITLTTQTERAVDIKFTYPERGCEQCTLIIFSHGANASYDGYDILIDQWVSHGFVVAAPLHVDSEAHPRRNDYGRQDHLPMRLEDLALLLSFTEDNDFNELPGVDLNGKFVAAGHSFGALVMQIAGGAIVAGMAWEDEASPSAVVAISPPGPVPGLIDTQAWSTISVPMLVVTGTEDTLPVIAPDWRDHLASFESAASKYSLALVFDGVDHYFNGAFGRLDPQYTEDHNIRQLNVSLIRFIDHSLEGRAVSEMNLIDDGDLDGVRLLRKTD